MSNTYSTLYENEKRNIQLKIRNNDETKFLPDSATFTVFNSSTTTVETSACSIDENVITATITPLTTVNTGNYEVIWKINKNSQIFYHKTILTILEL